MKNLFLGAFASICLFGTAHAASVDDFIGTWQRTGTTTPDYVVFKHDGADLVALKYSRNTLTHQIGAQRYPASYQGDKVVVASKAEINAHSIDGKASVTVMGLTYTKVSAATNAPAEHS